MKKFAPVKSSYIALGFREDNIDFAIDSINDGVRREHIIESLTADYRGMTEEQSTALLNALYESNGGEFKKENKDGYITGILLCIVGGTGLYFLVNMLMSGEYKMKFLIFAIAATSFGLIKGPMILIKSFKGNYRHEDDPLSEI